MLPAELITAAPLPLHTHTVHSTGGPETTAQQALQKAKVVNVNPGCS